MNLGPSSLAASSRSPLPLRCRRLRLPSLHRLLDSLVHRPLPFSTSPLSVFLLPPLHTPTLSFFLSHRHHHLLAPSRQSRLVRRATQSFAYPQLHCRSRRHGHNRLHTRLGVVHFGVIHPPSFAFALSLLLVRPLSASCWLSRAPQICTAFSPCPRTTPPSSALPSHSISSGLPGTLPTHVLASAIILVSSVPPTDIPGSFSSRLIAHHVFIRRRCAPGQEWQT